MKSILIVIIFFIQFLIPQNLNREGVLKGKWRYIGLKDLIYDVKDSWRPVSYPFPSERLIFEFIDDGRKGIIHGFTTANKVSCEYQFGEYEGDNHTFEVSNLSTTENEEIGWGRNFWKHFEKASSYKVYHDTLIIDAERWALLFTLVEEK